VNNFNEQEHQMWGYCAYYALTVGECSGENMAHNLTLGRLYGHVINEKKAAKKRLMQTEN